MNTLKPDRLKVKTVDQKDYDIVYSHSFQSLIDELRTLNLTNKKIAIVTDSNVLPLYGAQIKELLKQISEHVILLSFDAGEKSKNINTVCNLYQSLIEAHFTRSDFLVALGGGVVGDICGFVAATYLRGIEFIQVPTTLLSQVDSSIGGKTGVDLNCYKNMIGAFKMPRLVYINLNSLQSLDERQFSCGMGEILKHALIANESYFVWIISNIYEILDRDIESLFHLVYESNLIKKEIVELDPFEKKERALLNFGHTIGHAIEKEKDFQLLHGECVALGCVAASYISYKRELITKEDYYEIRDMFVPFGLPISIDHINMNNVLEHTKSDKKMNGDHIRFILLKGIGHALIEDDVTMDEMKDALNEIYYDEENNNNE